MKEASNLVLLDTSILTDSPAVPRRVRFVCDPRYRSIRVKVIAESAGYSNFSGVMGQDIPFYPDSSQRVLTLLFYLGGAMCQIGLRVFAWSTRRPSGSRKKSGMESSNGICGESSPLYRTWMKSLGLIRTRSARFREVGWQ